MLWLFATRTKHSRISTNLGFSCPTKKWAGFSVPSLKANKKSWSVTWHGKIHRGISLCRWIQVRPKTWWEMMGWLGQRSVKGNIQHLQENNWTLNRLNCFPPAKWCPKRSWKTFLMVCHTSPILFRQQAHPMHVLGRTTLKQRQNPSKHVATVRGFSAWGTNGGILPEIASCFPQDFWEIPHGSSPGKTLSRTLAHGWSSTYGGIFGFHIWARANMDLTYQPLMSHALLHVVVATGHNLSLVGYIQKPMENPLEYTCGQKTWQRQ